MRSTRWLTAINAFSNATMRLGVVDAPRCAAFRFTGFFFAFRFAICSLHFIVFVLDMKSSAGQICDDDKAGILKVGRFAFDPMLTVQKQRISNGFLWRLMGHQNTITRSVISANIPASSLMRRSAIAA
jgi:hypothetical protein